MNNDYRIEHLKCGHCGNHLPVMGEFLTFQCERCHKYWIISSNALEPLSPARATLPDDYEGDPVYLPFWVIEIDRDDLRKNIESAIGNIREISSSVVQTKIENESSLIDELINDFTGDNTVMKTTRIVSSVCDGVKAPHSSELEFILRKIEQLEHFNVFVPAFHAVNTYAYIKVGRLLTKRQPAFRASVSENPGRPLMCSMRPEEARILIDYIFISTLPDSILENGDFLEKIHLHASSSPRLVEFPFELQAHSYESLIGSFHIARQLIEPTHVSEPARV